MNKNKPVNEKAYSLIGQDGNVFNIMGYVTNAMRRNGRSKDEIDAYLADAKSSNYDHALAVSMDMIEMINTENGYPEGYQFLKNANSEFESIKVKKKVTKKLDENSKVFSDVKQMLIEALKPAITEMKKAKTFKKVQIREMFHQIAEDENLFEEVIIGDISNDVFNVKSVADVSPRENYLYITDEDFDKFGFSLDWLLEYLNKNFLFTFTIYIINDKDVQLVFSNREEHKVFELLRSLANLYHIPHTELKACLYKK